jgi:hypothetical protein
MRHPGADRRPPSHAPAARPDSVRGASNGQVSAQRTLFDAKKPFKSITKSWHGIAWYFLRQEGLQTKAD